MDDVETAAAPESGETIKKSRGGLQNYDEIHGDGVQRVRGEFLSETNKARITIAITSMTFNMTCVNLFPDDQYIAVWIDELNLRLIIEPSVSYDRDGLKFANFKNGRNNPRKCMAKYFCPMLYEFMNWNPAAKYRSLAFFNEFESKKVIVFNLDECQQVFTEMFVTDDGKKKWSTLVNMPKDWKGRFGHTAAELESMSRVDFSSKLIKVDVSTGERRFGHIQAKLPTPEELIHQPYGGLSRRREDTENE